MKQYMVCFDIETPDGIVVTARTQREARVKARDRLLRRGLRKKDIKFVDIVEED